MVDIYNILNFFKYIICDFQTIFINFYIWNIIKSFISKKKLFFKFFLSY